MNVFQQANQAFQEKALTSPAVLVAFSGGKDSLVVLDMARRHFKTVLCFHMYFVPGLSVIDKELAKGKERWNVEILMCPHWAGVNCLADGVFCPNYKTFNGFKRMTVVDVYRTVMADTGIDLIATGAKKSDSFWRRRNIKSTKQPWLWHPLEEWNKWEILAYLKRANIDLPPSSGHSATGVDLSIPSLLWLYDEHKADFDKLCETFPYAESVVKRREFYASK